MDSANHAHATTAEYVEYVNDIIEAEEEKPDEPDPAQFSEGDKVMVLPMDSDGMGYPFEIRRVNKSTLAITPVLPKMEHSRRRMLRKLTEDA